MNQGLKQRIFNYGSMPGLIRLGTAMILGVVVLGWTLVAQADHLDKSDLNNDNAVDILDLQFFSSQYLNKSWELVDWCNFYESSVGNEKYFRKYTSERTSSFDNLLNFIAVSYNCQVILQAADKSDLNSDLVIDSSDLSIFSTNYLWTYWETVDWCLFHQSTLAGSEFDGRSTKYFLRHFGLLLSFINNHYGCGGAEPPPIALQLENIPDYLIRIADGANFSDDYYITDPIVGSLFIYDANLTLKGEIKGLSRPLGVIIDSLGKLLIGNDGRDNIEVYDPANGDLLAVFGEGQVRMPNAITTDILGNIYVTDSDSNCVHVFDPAYNPIRTIGMTSARGELDFPMDAEIIIRSGDGIANIQELFVADGRNKRIQVYDLEGNWLRSLTFAGIGGQGCDWMTGVCEIPAVLGFTRLQALEVDSLGRLHVLDNFAASARMFDPADGSFLGSYGEYGEEAGFLRLPMDVLITETNTAIVTAGDGGRIEVFTLP